MEEKTFINRSEAEILGHFNRDQKVKNIAHMPILDEFYIAFLKNYNSIEITPDICILNYVSAIKENEHFKYNYPEIAAELWIVGGTGQGDEWLLHKKDGSIFFYDHNQGAYKNVKNLIHLEISFYEFLQMAFLFRDLEDLLDKQDDKIEERQKEHFINILNSIKAGLYELYPFTYF